MSLDQTISNKNTKVKPGQLLLGKAQKEFGRDSHIVRDLLDHYRIPLIKTITILNKKYKMSFQEIADQVFNGQISRQSVQENYTEVKK